MKLIAGWRVLGLLGRGGMGAVYKVAPPGGGPLMALKMLDPREPLAALLGREQLAERFRREAAILSDLNHPNLVKVSGLGSHRGRPFYVMEYLCNNLGDLIGERYRAEAPSRALDPDMALDCGRQTLLALAALHGAGVVHRDLKPFNLMLDDQGLVKLGDLGLSKLRGEHQANPPNLIMGSPFYTAPEQEADPDAATPASDLYSLGVTLYRLLSGRLYKPGGAAVSRAAPDLEPAWDQLVMPLLRRDPSARPVDAGAVLAVLDQVATVWQGDRERACREHPDQPPAAAPPAGRPRRGPLKVAARQARKAFGLDRLWRPSRYTAGWLPGADPELVLHPATGLAWQRSGSAAGLTWPQARQAVEELNRRHPAGHPPWRLPTVAELATIMTPPPRLGDLCAPPLFDPAQTRLWSADRATFTSAWYVSLRVGFVGRQDFTCHNHLRAVRDMRQEEYP